MVSINDRSILAIKVTENDETCGNLLEIPRIYTPSQIATKIDIVDSDTPFARMSVITKVQKALELLPNNYGFVLIEGYRRYAVQKALFNKRFTLLQNQHPQFSTAQLHEETVKYVSDPDIYSPHVTGGAIDLAIVNENKELLDMGNLFEYTDTANLYSSNLNDTQKENRQLLISVMERVGLVNYPYEWWHWSYGDKYWAFVSGQNAVYDSLHI